jgi:DNA-binding response OmpR family regulator
MAKIILIDDDPHIRDVFSRLLKSKGHTVITAADGLNAVLLIKNNIPDLIILDRNLPFATGESVFKKVKEISRAIKIIILTGYDDEPSKEHYLEMGANMFISKSEGITNIMAKIESLITEEKPGQKRKETIEETKPLIMVVDDDEYIRGFLSKFLKSKGFDSISASNGREALTYIENKKICVVLLDIFMPEMDGKEFLEIINTRTEKPHIVVISGNEDEDLAREFLKKGAVDYIKKPINLERLELIIRTLTVCS